MPSPFDYITAISHTKADIFHEDPTGEKDYNPWMTNKGLSYFHDTIEYANNMNILYHLDKEHQWSYLINIVRPRKRFSKWVKKSTDSDLKAVMQYYGYSISKAQTALSILTPEQLEHIKTTIQEAGNDR